jgi:hypothetical protein
MAGFAACTIIAKHQLAKVRVLVKSWKAHHPDEPFFVLLLDSPNGLFSPCSEPGTWVSVTSLGVPNLNTILFRYCSSECSLALRPRFLKYIFETYQIESLLYLGADALVLNSFRDLLECSARKNVLLVPYLLAPIPGDGRIPSEANIVESGVFNPECILFRNAGSSLHVLSWLENRLNHPIVENLGNKPGVDPEWFKLLPSLFGGVDVVRDAGYGVGYWNLHERSISVAETTTVNGVPLKCIHFAGFNPIRPDIISTYQNRYQMRDIGDARFLYQKYREALLQEGWEESHRWSYDHNFFANGKRIPTTTRKCFCALPDEVIGLRNPFEWLQSDDPADQ